MLCAVRRKGLVSKITKAKKTDKANKNNKPIYKKLNKKARSKATTTRLINSIFKTFFPHHLDETDSEIVARKQKCGVCECCQLPDCGQCRACYSMRKFGGDGTLGRVCGRRLCPNMDIEDSEESELDEKEQEMPDEIDDIVPVKLNGRVCKRTKWVGKPVKVDDKKIYYERILIEGVEYTLGDYVMVAAAMSTLPAVVTRLQYMWEDVQNKNGYFHCEAFVRSSDTILGEAGNPREVFLMDRCCHGVPLSSILRKANVEKRDSLKVFNTKENESDEKLLQDDGITFFYLKYYELFIGRFSDLPVDPECPNVHRKHRFCPSCERKQVQYLNLIPRVSGRFTTNSEAVLEADKIEFTSVKWKGNEYKKGCAVFLRVGTFKLKNSLRRKRSPKIKKEVDEKIYTEYYRKKNSKCSGYNKVTKGSPFYVGYIENVIVARHPQCHPVLIPPQQIYLRVRILYRPENTTCNSPQNEDLNMVYWSNEIRDIPFLAVVAPCQLIYVDNIPQQENSIHEWLEADPCRIYFRQSFSPGSGEFSCVPPEAKIVGLKAERQFQTIWKGKGKVKGKSNNSKHLRIVQEGSVKPLKTMDVFAGCGGLSEGLHRSGIAECKWAIEYWEAAADAFALNNTDCTVFNEDCNVLLREAMAGATHSASGLRIPKPGEVELLCGGPPCQGFSVLNRFSKSDYSIFMNSLVVSFLAYCDYYRPKYIVMENVRNFAVYQRGMVLKLTMRALLAMGYQCAFQVLQAGCYGIPQVRRRFILLATAPGLPLPKFPEPTNVFYKRACSQNIYIDKKLFRCELRWRSNGVRRSVTTRDALDDLPRISNDSEKHEIHYGSNPETYFQRLVRGNNDTAKVQDHICKKMSPLNKERIRRIPTTPGSDWRDLPNIAVKLSDGTRTKRLVYRHREKKRGRAVRGPIRGVCACAAGRPCSREERQINTLIPWCLPHTGKRHAHYKNVYGRIAWDGYFSTTVTDPEPMGKQGRVLHPDQHRVISVRECARSQGFPDSFKFVGSVADKYRQIGNAVPPPLAAALGREIRKALMGSVGSAILKEMLWMAD